jgi:GNAT superfamily N-acetyltransferase
MVADIGSRAALEDDRMMQQPQVRRGSVVDLDRIRAIDTAHSDLRAAQLHQLALGAGGLVLVAEEHADATSPLIGYVAMASGHFFECDFIELLVVREQDRRRGVGALLLNAAVEAAQSPTVFTSANESNTPMRALLTREGWLVSGTLDGLDPGDPEVVYLRQR